ncbi:uncharacterized protein C6orf132 homolog [Schistocerca americana]|uniref:uncharacterized protein C6orf132 homolog n=1 Tax=Schistocerca americana TaxID=7009 RepID=UPI001F4FF98C|nr:uncharacterized protein C6orf132 homolog [Schistocerca americana]
MLQLVAVAVCPSVRLPACLPACSPPPPPPPEDSGRHLLAAIVQPLPGEIHRPAFITYRRGCCPLALPAPSPPPPPLSLSSPHSRYKMSLTHEERIEIILISGERSTRVVAEDFNSRHPTRQPITHSAVAKLLAKFRATGSVADKPKAGRPKSATDEATTVSVLASFSKSPQQSTRRLSQEYLVRGGFQLRLSTSLPPPGQQQQPSPLPRRQPVPLMPPAQLHPGAPQVVAPAPAVPLQSPPPSELMDVDPSAGPPSQAVAVQPVLQPLSLFTPKESDTAAPCPAPTQQSSTQRQETLPLFVGPDAPSRPVPEAAPVVTGIR